MVYQLGFLESCDSETDISNMRRTEQIIGREGETATLLSRCPLNFSLHVGGFAPRQFNRYMASDFQSARLSCVHCEGP